jgi:cholesterol oxidase
VDALQGASLRGRVPRTVRARNVIFAGGVLGTVPLLLKLRASPAGLPRLSARVGEFVRTNSEALLGIISGQRQVDHSRGIAIGSVLHTDAHSHLEPVRYNAGSGFYRLLVAPHAGGSSPLTRVLNAALQVARHPVRMLRALFVVDWAKHAIILLYMRTTEGHLRLTLGAGGRLTTRVSGGKAPSASIPEATDLARRVGEKVDGLPQGLVTELLLDTPTTAHILGGACMGQDAEQGVIDHRHRAFGYQGLYVIDGAAISANPGVNPSLTITALAERAMTFVPPRGTAPAALEAVADRALPV